jgi:uncharacterized protein (TIGR02594 family)
MPGDIEPSRVQELTAFTIAMRYVGVAEFAGVASNPLVLAMLQIVDAGARDDAVPWCSAFVEFHAWQLGLPRPRSLRARSWLLIGDSVTLEGAVAAWDVVILARGPAPQPGPEVIAAPGHVGFFAGLTSRDVFVCGGNQNNRVSVRPFPRASVLGVRRLRA